MKSNFKILLGGKNVKFSFKKKIFYVLEIFIFCFIFVIGSTYAYLTLSSSNNSVSGTGGCFEVNYSGQEINASDLSSTTNYKDGTNTTITLSKNADCEIYNYANIYIHTNTTSTSPIESVPALRYKIVTSGSIAVNNTTKEYNGIVSESGDFLIATIPLSETATDYIVYLWVDSNLSSGNYNDTTYSGYIYATSIQTSTVGGSDTTNPVLFLATETYLEGFDNWTFTNAYVDSDDVLIIAESATSGSAVSPYYNVDGENWNFTFEAYTTTASTNNTPYGGTMVNINYYDDALQAVTSDNTGSSHNGWSSNLTLNTWSNTLNFRTMSSWGAATLDSKVKNTKVTLSTGNSWSQPILKIRNFKFYGQLENSFYDIYIEASDDTEVDLIKYAYGEQEKSYFQSNGTTITENSIRVTKNGYYTIYVKDTSGNETVSTILIDKIV